MLWSLEPECGLVQRAPARTSGCLAPCPALLGTGQGRGRCAGPRSPCGLIGSTCLGYVNTHVQHLSFIWSPWRARRLLGFCGTASSSELWEGVFHLQEFNPSLPQSPDASGPRGLDVALSTLLAEAGPARAVSGGSCGQKMAQTLTRAWQGLEGADKEG